MPTVAILPNGVRIIIRGRDHLPAHVHVEWRSESAALIIASGDIYAGALTGHVHTAARAYIAENAAALTAQFFAQNPQLPQP
jgi:hypothetical protein